MHKIKLSRLDPEKQIAAGSIITIVGRLNSGKSKICLHLMYLLREKFEFVIAMTPGRLRRQGKAAAIDAVADGRYELGCKELPHAGTDPRATARGIDPAAEAA